MKGFICEFGLEVENFSNLLLHQFFTDPTTTTKTQQQ